MIRYSINRKHPLVAALLGIDHAGTKSAANAVIEVIEQSFPVAAFSQDATKNLDEIHQTEADPRAFRQQVEAALPMMLNDVGGDFIRLAQLMKHTEPFSRHWKTVNAILEEKGWSSAGT